MPDAVRVGGSGERLPFGYFLYGNEDGGRADFGQKESADHGTRRESATCWLSGRAGVLKVELEVAVMQTFQAM